MIIPPQVKPAPKTTNIILSPGFILPDSADTERDIGTVAEEVFPYSFIVMINFDSGSLRRLAAD